MSYQRRTPGSSSGYTEHVTGIGRFPESHQVASCVGRMRLWVRVAVLDRAMQGCLQAIETADVAQAHILSVFEQDVRRKQNRIPALEDAIRYLDEADLQETVDDTTATDDVEQTQQDDAPRVPADEPNSV